MSTVTAVNGTVQTRDEWAEGTPVGYDVEFKDEDGVAYTPASVITAKAINGNGVTIEELSDIAAASTIEVTTLAATNNIGSYGKERILSLQWTAVTTRYPSPGILQRCEIHYSINDLKGF